MTGVVNLTRLWFNEATTPTHVRSFGYVGESYKVTSKVGGGVESGYASGRSRGYSTQDDTVQLQVTLEGLTVADEAWLREHRGVTLCVRDPFGLKFFGVFYETPFTVSHLPPPVSGTVGRDTCDLTVDSVTWSEAV